MKLVYRFLIIFGIFCYVFGIYLIWERNNPNRLAFKSFASNYKNVKASSPPVRIIISDLQIDLPVYPAKIINNEWQASTEGASFLTSSPFPGETGNSIIYAHDWTNLFGPLLNAKVGQNVEIVFADKSKKNFIISYTTVVPLNMPGILAQTNDRRLTLYTCTGFLDSQRMVAVASLIK